MPVTTTAGGTVRLVSGWGRATRTASRLLRPTTPQQAANAVRARDTRGLIARGLGRAYGDAAQNAGGTVLDMTGLDRVRAIDAQRGTVVCEAGVSLHRLMKVLLPLGWFVPVTPGTRHITVGGALCADIHGKNHHISGSFTRHVRSLDLLTADGEIRTVTPERDPCLFWATAGGMGLTGVVLAVTFDLLPVRTSWLSVDTERARDLDDLLARLEATDHHYRYSVAWVDLLARGGALGRAVLIRGDHAEPTDLPPAQRSDPLALRTRTLPSAPRWMPSGLLNRSTVGVFNRLYYRRAPLQRRGELQSIPAFFHPLDTLPNWNRVYGPRGLVQYQFVVGYGAEDSLRRMVERISESGCPSFLAVLKRFGAGDPGWLSFPMAGWTLALDVPAAMPGLGGMLDALDEEVAKAGGRVYLAKDSRLRPELLDVMYPALKRFRELRARIDPTDAFASDLARRLSL